MFTEDQTKALQALLTEAGLDESKAAGATEKLGAFLEPVAQSAADAVVAEQVAGIKRNRDEFRTDLDKYKPLGKPEEIQASIEELETLRKAKGKKPDQKELESLAEDLVERRVGAYRTEQETLRKALEEERDGEKSTAEKLRQALLRAHRRAVIVEHVGEDVKPLMMPYLEQRLGPMLKPAESDNGSEWWERDVIPWRVVDPETGAPLVGASGARTPKEFFEASKAGNGDKDWNSKEFADTFYRARGKGGGARPAEGPSVGATGAVDPTASSYDHFGALFGEST